MSKSKNENVLSFLESSLPLLLRSRLLMPGILLAVGTLGILTNQQPLGNWEWVYYDSLYKAKARIEQPTTSSEIAHLSIEKDIVTAEEHSSQTFYNALIDAVRLCDQLGASTIGIDVFLGSEIKELNTSFHNSLKELSKRSGFNIVLAGYIARSPADQSKIHRRSLPTLESEFNSGLINISPETDGIYRQYNYTQPLSEFLLPSLALQCYAKHRNLKIEPIDGELVLFRLSNDFSTLERLESFDDSPRPLGIFPMIASFNLEELRNASESEKNILAGRMVIISFREDGADLGTTPLGVSQPLVNLHLNAVNDLLSGNRIELATKLSNIMAIGFIVFSFTLIIPLAERYSYVSVIWLGIVNLCFAMVFFVVEIYLQNTFLIALSSTLVLVNFCKNLLKETFVRKRLDDTLGAYFSPKVYQDILQRPGALEPRETKLTLLLSDLRNFTQICESIDSKIVFRNVSSLFEIQSEACLTKRGNLENLVGDQFLAYWGEPNPIDTPADHAYAALNEILLAIDQYDKNWDKSFRGLFGIGFALNSGVGLVGNKGTTGRMNYGLLGDIVNTTARLESLTKFYSVDTLVTSSFLKEMSSPPPYRLIDRVTLRGQSNPVEIFEIKTVRNHDGFELRAKHYERCLAHFQKGELDEARSGLEVSCLQGDGPSKALKRKL
ncbi:CHASE2 domain-containing protein [Puniceicoccaceae bacterium K14]|nr:CHASE2 domain-containing protein [Puniceicoccaceae bacterium K14]